MAVWVIGAVNVDVALPVERLPGPGATVLAGDPVRSGGGKGANAAVAAARDGADVRLVAAVGRDDAGERSLAELAADGVGTDGVAVLADRPTGMAMICVDAEGENFVVVAAGANLGLTPAHVERALAGLATGDVCVASFEIPADAVAAAGRVAAARGATLVVNPSPVRPLDAEVLAAAPIVIANAGEMRELTGEEDAGAAAAALRDRGCSAALVTLGGDGARVLADGGEAAIAAFPARPADTTGAGDTFTGVVAGALAGGADVVAAARRAAAAAALSTERIGARAAMPARAATDALLASRS